MSGDRLSAAIDIQWISHEQGLGPPLFDYGSDPAPIRPVIMNGNNFQRRRRVSQGLTNRHAYFFRAVIKTEQGNLP